MGHPLSGTRETWLAPNVQSSCGTRHLPTALPDAEFGDPELGPLGMRDMLRNATFFGLDEAASPRDRGSGLGELCELGGVGYRKILV